MQYITYGISDTFTRKVSLVVMAIDDFTGKAILGSNIRVFIDGAAPAIKKQDGHHVFVNLAEPVVTVHAVGGQFNPRSVQCRLDAHEETYTFLKLRMIPNRSYPIPPNTTCVEGKAAPGSLIRIICRDAANAYKLLYAYKKEKTSDRRTISIFHPDEVDLEGKLLYISGNKGQDQELLRITAVVDKENKLYSLEEGLSSDYKKVGTSLFPVHETTAEESGYFFLPIANTYKERCLYTCEMLGEKTLSLELELESGKVNKVNLQ